MADEKRFDDREVAQLIERAAQIAARDEAKADAEPDTALALPEPRGLTLAQVQEIAHAAGIPADAVARAAAAAARGDLVPTAQRTAFGIPIGVSRQVELPRMMTDVEWDRVVIRLRETFGAEGKVTREGSIRSWRNGNLRIALEPTATGSRVRMSTLRTDAPIRTQVGIGALALSGVMAGLLALAPQVTARNWDVLTVIAGLGAVTLVRNALMLPRWARTRAEQMEQLSATIGEIVEGRE